MDPTDRMEKLILDFRRQVENLNSDPQFWDQQRCSLYLTRVAGREILRRLDAAMAELQKLKGPSEKESPEGPRLKTRRMVSDRNPGDET